MADSKGYYYMRLKDDFFDTSEMVVLESLPDGYLYSNILLKLYLRSLRGNGRLMFNNTIPYNPKMIAAITRHQVGTVEKALKIFCDMGLIEILDSGAIYMLNIQNYIGRSTTEADRKRAYRDRIEQEKSCKLEGAKGLEMGIQNTPGQISDKCPDKSPPEIEIEKELELDLELLYMGSETAGEKNADRPSSDNLPIKAVLQAVDIDQGQKRQKHFITPTVEEVRAYCEERKNNVDPEQFVDFYSAKGWMIGNNKMKDWKACVRTWERNKQGTQRENTSGNPFLDMLKEIKEAQP